MLELELIKMKIENILFHNKIMKKIKRKRCKGCKYLINSGGLTYCEKSNIYIEPLKLFCRSKDTSKNIKDSKK